MDTRRAERLHLVGAGLVALVIALVGWFLLISPQRSDTADIQSQTADTELQSMTLQSRIAQLDGQQRKWHEYQAALVAARQALPSDTGATAFLRQLQTIAAATRTTLGSVSIGDLTAVTPPAASVAPATGATPAPSATPAPAGTAPGTASGLLQLPITASVTGSNAALASFLARLQSAAQPRAVLVSEIIRGAADGGTTGNGTTGGRTTMQLTMAAFVAPAPSAAASTTGGD